MMVASPPLLSVRDLVVRYPGRGNSRTPLTAVKGVSLDIPAAGIYGLVGESGSGKSSLAHAIVQLVRPASGQVLFRGQDLVSLKAAKLNTARRHIQFVFQGFQQGLQNASTRAEGCQRILEYELNMAAC